MNQEFALLKRPLAKTFQARTGVSVKRVSVMMVLERIALTLMSVQKTLTYANKNVSTPTAHTSALANEAIDW